MREHGVLRGGDPEHALLDAGRAGVGRGREQAQDAGAAFHEVAGAGERRGEIMVVGAVHDERGIGGDGDGQAAEVAAGADLQGSLGHADGPGESGGVFQHECVRAGFDQGARAADRPAEDEVGGGGVEAPGQAVAQGERQVDALRLRGEVAHVALEADAVAAEDKGARVGCELEAAEGRVGGEVIVRSTATRDVKHQSRPLGGCLVPIGGGAPSRLRAAAAGPGGEGGGRDQFPIHRVARVVDIEERA